jgi:hypothetical protein
MEPDLRVFLSICKLITTQRAIWLIRQYRAKEPHILPSSKKFPYFNGSTSETVFSFHQIFFIYSLSIIRNFLKGFVRIILECLNMTVVVRMRTIKKGVRPFASPTFFEFKEFDQNQRKNRKNG